MVYNNKLSPEEMYKIKKINIAKKGLFLAWISSVTMVIQGILNNMITEKIEYQMQSDYIKVIIIAITLLAINDIIAGIWTTFYNIYTKRGWKEIKRMCNLKISWVMLLSALVAGPFATGCWMSSVNFCGITYTTAIISLSPIITAIIGKFVFKENLNKRIYFGISIAIIGVIITNWIQPEGANKFYLGVLLAILAPIGFTIESMLSTYASDLIDPIVGCGIFRCFGSGILGLIIMIFVTYILKCEYIIFDVIKITFTQRYICIFMLFMGLASAISYATTYTAFNKSGPTRTLAVVYTTPIWSIPIGFLFNKLIGYSYIVTKLGIIGAVIVVVGILLVIAKPSELFSLRDI